MVRLSQHRLARGGALGACAPQGRKKIMGAKFTGESCKCTPRHSVHPSRQSKSPFLGNWDDLDGGSG